MFISKHVTDHKFLEDVHEDSLQNSKTEKLVPVQQSRQAFEGVWMPHSI